MLKPLNGHTLPSTGTNKDRRGPRSSEFSEHAGRCLRWSRAGNTSTQLVDRQRQVKPSPTLQRESRQWVRYHAWPIDRPLLSPLAPCRSSLGSILIPLLSLHRRKAPKTHLPKPPTASVFPSLQFWSSFLRQAGPPPASPGRRRHVRLQQRDKGLSQPDRQSPG